MKEMMSESASFEAYLDHLCEGLGHADRRTGLKDYCRGLMLPIERKSVEPLAAQLEPAHVSAKHQSLHHFVAHAAWSDEAVLSRVREWVIPALETADGYYWIVDDVGMPKKGTHSVGVARQYCGQLGKQDNCQVAVSLSLATAAASVPVALRLYLPQDWAEDLPRRRKAGVPEAIEFASKPVIALSHLRQAQNDGMPVGIVLADAGYGDDTAFRDGVTELGLTYTVGIRAGTSVWAPGTAPLPPKPWSGRGQKPKRLRREPGHEPVSVKTLALELPPDRYQHVTWREGTQDALTSRFATVRVRPAHRDDRREHPRAEEWLLIEWPDDEAEPTKYGLSTLPAETSLERLVFVAKMRWRIERDYQELKQEFGLAQYEGRHWRGFHHHATLCIAAYGYLIHRRLTQRPSQPPVRDQKRLPYPPFTSPDAGGRYQRHVPDSIASLRALIARDIARRLPHCPCCGTARQNL
jgi:SRSO17 transposase